MFWRVQAWLSLLMKGLMGLVTPRLLFAVTSGERLREGLVSTLTSLALIALGLSFGQDQLDNPQLIGGILHATITTTICKLVTFFWCVFPALTGKYPMLRLPSTAAVKLQKLNCQLL